MPSGMHATESNHFGVHEFMRLCRLIGAEPYLAANVGSGTPEGVSRLGVCTATRQPDTESLADERARNGDADPFRVKYWGVGNESWGCGGDMTPGEYATAVPEVRDAVPRIRAAVPHRHRAARPFPRHGSRAGRRASSKRCRAATAARVARLLAALLHRLPQRPDAGRRLHAAGLVCRAPRRTSDRGGHRGALVGDGDVRSGASHQAGDRRVGRVVQARAKRSRPATS